MLDNESLRIESLIEEREIYENSFFVMEDISKSNEFDNAIIQYELNQEFNESFDFEDELSYSFVLEDELENLRIEKLIRERESYEIQYFRNLNAPSFEMDSLDIQIQSYDEGDFYPEPDFGYFDDCYIEEPVMMNKPSCGYDLDYLPNDDNFDYLDCYDYPDGPDENLSGIIFHF